MNPTLVTTLSDPDYSPIGISVCPLLWGKFRWVVRYRYGVLENYRTRASLVSKGLNPDLHVTSHCFSMHFSSLLKILHDLVPAKFSALIPAPSPISKPSLSWKHTGLRFVFALFSLWTFSSCPSIQFGTCFEVEIKFYLLLEHGPDGSAFSDQLPALFIM